MNKNAFVLGNGESRQGIKIADLKPHGKVWACNGVYRSEEPDVLVAVDPKMICEIAETDYVLTHEVWSNYNHQYDKNDKIRNHIQFFTPSLGWSSGPTALKHAADQSFEHIYILGFDYEGCLDPDKNKTRLFNNIFKDTRNYKKSKDTATFYGNWMNQTKSVLRDYPNIQFYRVTPRGWFRPHDLEFNSNFKHIDIEEFLKIHNLQIKI
jgi:hypothetical protein